MKHSSYDNFFTNFANRTKFSIIRSLIDGPLSVTAIANKIGEEQSKVSHSLKKLSSCHILDVKQKGKQRIYSLNNETVIPMLELAKEHVKRNCLRSCNK